MATPSQKLAESLKILKDIQDRGVIAIQTKQISRTHRERLLSNGFINEVYQGWYIIASPGELKRDSTSWYSSYWTFCSQFLNYKYKENWYVSAEQSLMLHAGNWSVPQQLIIRSPKANNFKTELPFRTSLFHMKTPKSLKKNIAVTDGLRVMTLPAALINSSSNTFTQNATDARTALSMIKDPSVILELLLEGGQTTVAGRLAGAFRNIKREKIADEIVKTMKKVGYDIRESDPFNDQLDTLLLQKVVSPYGNRIRLMWAEMRKTVIKIFPAAPQLPKNMKKYLKEVEEMYVTDAYHSLSIEKYKVTPELIEKVRIGNWNVKGSEEDRKQRDAMAAKGYWDAFQVVEKSIERILMGENAGEVLDDDHADWFRELFGPSVLAGILKASDLSGYRNDQVYIGQSKHVPLNKEAVRDAMPVLFDLIKEEKEASVRAVLGHFIFVFIHPYMDGNGRMGRFIFNAMLASGGYQWTVIPVEQRKIYMAALEQASVNQNIGPFTEFLSYLVKQSMKGTPVAKLS